LSAITKTNFSYNGLFFTTVYLFYRPIINFTATGQNLKAFKESSKESGNQWIVTNKHGF